ncbi:MAG: hypothetical protein NT031_19375, partial [Planctomycetota bacterium]|nr:hypothetical protein [Planctomycetota bacterium]
SLGGVRSEESACPGVVELLGGTPKVVFGRVRWALGLLLLVAAGLEGYRLVTEPTAEKDVFSYRWVLMGVVEFEILLGIWLLTGVYKRLAWLVTLTCFAVFTGVTLTKGLHGEASCGCFGKVEVNPWYTFVLDVAAVLALAIFRPNLRRVARVPHYRIRMGLGLAVVIAAGLPLGLAMGSFRPVTVSDEGSLTEASGIVLLEPEKWPGKPFGLLQHIDVGQRLSRGRWVVMLFHHGCPTCAEAIPRYRRMARDLRNPEQLSVALIEMPPHQKSESAVPPGKEGPMWGKLDGRREWFVTTPAVALLVDGVVKAAWEGSAPTLEQVLQRIP